MSSLFNYTTNFREYLRDYYLEKQKKHAKFSYGVFAQRLQCNRSFLYNVINSNKHLSDQKAICFARLLKLNNREKDYFIDLVKYTQAEDDEVRDYYWNRMLELRTDGNSATYLLQKDQYEYYSTWYHSAIRSIIDIFPFRDEYFELARKLTPQITPGQAKSSITLLERLDLIRKNKKGIYYVTGKSIWAGSNISDVCLKRFHREFTELAKDAILSHYPDQCKAISLTLGMSRKSFEHIWKKMVAFTDKNIDLANKDDEPDGVYQCQMIMFPLSSSETSNSGKNTPLNKRHQP